MDQVMVTPLSATQTLQLARAALKSGHGAGLPELLKLIETLSANIGETSISDIAELIEKDPAVLCRLLCVANTIVHNPNVAPMTSIPHAIHQLGFKRVRSLAVSLMLLKNTGGPDNPPEQREATAKALCSGLLAHGCAHNLGSVDPELAFACAALRQFGHIVLPVVSLEHYREVPELMKTMSEDLAYTELFGLTPLELSRHLLGAANLPAEVLESLNECDPGAMSATLSSTYAARILGVADFSCRLASLAMDGGNNAAKFDTLSLELTQHFESLLPGVGTSLDAILLHTEERIGAYTRSENSSTLPAPSLERIKSRVLHKNPSAGKPVNAPVKAGISGSVPPIQGTAHPHGKIPVETKKGATTPPVAAATPAAAAADTPVPVWAEQLAHTTAFETQVATPPPVVDRWSATLTFVRDSFGAQESWVFIPAPGGESFSILQGVGASWQDFRACAAIRADERTVFGICLARRENVVIHSTIEPTLAPYLPKWYRETKGAPGAFILMPLHNDGRTHGLVLIGWNLPQRITVSAAQTELARQLFASAIAAPSPSSSVPSRAA
jgi:HD-like signal output (HDOD) protein